MTDAEKRTEFYNYAGRYVSIICAMFGAYAIPDTVFSYYGWSKFLQGGISFILFICSITFIGIAVDKSEYDLLKKNFNNLPEEIDSILKYVSHVSF